MEEKELEEKSRKEAEEAAKKRAAQGLTMKVLIGFTVVIIGYVVYGLVTKDLNMVVFEILLGVFVAGYLILTDVVEPYRMGLFAELTKERKMGFLKMMLMDVIGAGALLYWITGMESETNSVVLPLLIYFVCAQAKRKFRDEFEGVKPEDSEEEEEAAEESGGEKEVLEQKNFEEEEQVSEEENEKEA